MDVLSTGVNVCLDDLITFRSELSISWNLQLTFEKILHKYFSNSSKSFMAQGLLTVFKPA